MSKLSCAAGGEDRSPKSSQKERYRLRCQALVLSMAEAVGLLSLFFALYVIFLM